MYTPPMAGDIKELPLQVVLENKFKGERYICRII